GIRSSGQLTKNEGARCGQLRGHEQAVVEGWQWLDQVFEQLAGSFCGEHVSWLELDELPVRGVVLPHVLSDHATALVVWPHPPDAGPREVHRVRVGLDPRLHERCPER